MKFRRSSIRLFNFLLAGFVGLAAALPLQLPADDTDIYLGSSTAVGSVQPNVLFVLDTSSSMNGKDGTPYTRLDRMKTALHTILDIATNINVGLMRFHSRGGPVLYPVSDIDADVCTVEGGCPDLVADPDPDPDPDPDVVPPPVFTGMQNRTYVISDDDDDGMQGTLGSVNLDGVRLHVGNVNVSGVADTLVEVRVNDDDDDAEEDIDDAGMYLDSGDLELSHEGSKDQISGMRFASVNVPQGATIVSAEIVFVIDEDDSSMDAALDLDVWGESATGSRARFSNTDYDISSRTPTSARVNWNDVAFPSKGDQLRSAELSPIVQEIVDNPAWNPNQAMVFMIQRDAADTAGGNRIVETHDGSNGDVEAPLLRIRYAAGGFTTTYLIGVRYQGVDVPHGSTITNAELDFNAGNANSEATKVTIYGEDVEPFEVTYETRFDAAFWQTRGMKDVDLQRVVSLANDGLKQREIAIDLNMSLGKVNRLHKEGVSAGLIKA